MAETNGGFAPETIGKTAADLALKDSGDINKVNVPNPRLEYPKHLHGPKGAWIEVRSKADEDAKLAEGWSLTPVLHDATPASAAPAQSDALAEADAPDAAPAPRARRSRKPTAAQ